jgi:hypothetical protein
LSDDFTNLIGLNYLIAFLLKRPIDKKQDHRQNYQTRNISNLSGIAKIFDSMAEKILPMFKDQKTISEWKTDFKKYITDEKIL